MKKKRKTVFKYCKCGCGELVYRGKKFISGHNFRNKKHTKAAKEKIRKARIAVLKKKEDDSKAHHLFFPKKKRKEAEGEYRFRKFEYFCEHYVAHVHGRWAGKPVRLMGWQRKILHKLIGTLGKNGKRIYRFLFLHIGRKNGKTFLVCLLILYWLAEESRRDPAAEIASCANTRDQSIKTIFRTARLMVERSKELSQLIKIKKVPASMENRLTNALYEPLSADAKHQLGQNNSLAIFDETHGQPNDELWNAMKTSQSAREEPLFISISTSGDSRASFYYSIYEYMKKILKDPKVDPTALILIYEVPEELDWRDPKNFLMANPAMGDKDEEGFRSKEELKLFLKDAIEGEGEAGFRQFYLNQWAQHGQRTLVSLDKWDLCKVEDLELTPDMKECRVVGGLDLSSTTDLTGLAIIIEWVLPETKAKIWITFTFAWLAGENLNECSKRDKLPYEKWERDEVIFFDGKPVIQIEAVLDILAKLKAYFPKFEKIGYDPYLIAKEPMGENEKKVSNSKKESPLKLLEPYFELIPVPQQYAFLSPSIKLLKNRILGKTMQHDGNPLLRSCLENARVLEDPSGNIRLDKGKSTARIDPLVALTIAGVIAIKENFNK